jgi:hypothetical protein
MTDSVKWFKRWLMAGMCLVVLPAAKSRPKALPWGDIRDFYTGTVMRRQDVDGEDERMDHLAVVTM